MHGEVLNEGRKCKVVVLYECSHFSRLTLVGKVKASGKAVIEKACKPKVGSKRRRTGPTQPNKKVKR